MVAATNSSNRSRAQEPSRIGRLCNSQPAFHHHELSPPRAAQLIPMTGVGPPPNAMSIFIAFKWLFCNARRPQPVRLLTHDCTRCVPCTKLLPAGIPGISLGQPPTGFVWNFDRSSWPRTPSKRASQAAPRPDSKASVTQGVPQTA
jgi:hypothetical protein